MKPNRIVVHKNVLAEMLSQLLGLECAFWEVAPDGEFLGVIVTGDSNARETVDSWAKLAAASPAGEGSQK